MYYTANEIIYKKKVQGVITESTSPTYFVGEDVMFERGKTARDALRLRRPVPSSARIVRHFEFAVLQIKYDTNNYYI